MFDVIEHVMSAPYTWPCRAIIDHVHDSVVRGQLPSVLQPHRTPIEHRTKNKATVRGTVSYYVTLRRDTKTGNTPPKTPHTRPGTPGQSTTTRAHVQVCSPSTAVCAFLALSLCCVSCAPVVYHDFDLPRCMYVRAPNQTRLQHYQSCLRPRREYAVARTTLQSIRPTVLAMIRR